MMDAGVGYGQPEPHCDKGRWVGHCCRLEGDYDGGGLVDGEGSNN